MKRLIVTFLILSLLVSFVPAYVLGDALHTVTSPLSENAALTENKWREPVSGRRQNERYLLLANGETTPSVVYGYTLFGKSTMDTIERYPDAWGMTVVAGVNGSFFDMASGVPYGCVITGGCVRSSGDREAVGFRADGSAIIGYPKLSIDLSFPGGQTLRGVNCNKITTKANGVNLYTRDYDYATKNTIDTYNVVLKPSNAELKLNSRITAEVTEIRADVKSCAIPDGCFLLSCAAQSDYAVTMDATIRSLQAGDTVTIDVSIGDGWGEVVSACAGMEMLVLGGEAQKTFSLAGNSTRTARTAVGLQSDGTLIFYTVDAAGGSSGITLRELAQRMTELGCVTALNLDGGGSTAIRVRYPGKAESETINSPADGKLRKCANFVFLTHEKSEAGAAVHLFAYPHNAVALPGGSVPLEVKATDAHYNPVAAPETVAFTAEGGTVVSGALLAQTVGTATVTMTADGASGKTSVLVIETPDAITLTRENSTSAGGSIVSGETARFTASASYLGSAVYASQGSFVWTCDSAIGAIDPEGTFTAAKVYQPTTGNVTCTAGSRSQTAKLTVLPDYPFPDAETHWAREEIRTLYDAGVLRGAEVDGIPYFRPDDGMTRQEFFVALMRYLGTNLTQYDAAELPFADSEQIASWALPSVRAAYALGYLGGSAQDGALYALPDKTISRQEAIVILSRTLKNTEGDPALLTPFSDWETVAPWAQSGMSAMIQIGAVSGSDGQLLPLLPVTRAQAAKLLAVMRK